MNEQVGLIAGDGALPALIARAAREGGARVHAIGFRGITDPALEGAVDRLDWMDLGPVAPVLERLHGAGVKRAVVAGKVTKAHLFDRRDRIVLDEPAERLLARLGDLRDDTILCALAELLCEEGIELRPQRELVPELLAPAGPLGRHAPSAAERADLAFGLRMARALGRMDAGQTVVVKDRAVLALEAIEGTDATIARGCALGGPGAVIVKVAKPRQDPRFDVPVVGPGTLRAALAGGARVLAFEAQQTLLIDREALIEHADRAGVALVGLVDADARPAPDAAAAGEGGA